MWSAFTAILIWIIFFSSSFFYINGSFFAFYTIPKGEWSTLNPFILFKIYYCWLFLFNFALCSLLFLPNLKCFCCMQYREFCTHYDWKNKILKNILLFCFIKKSLVRVIAVTTAAFILQFLCNYMIYNKKISHKKQILAHQTRSMATFDLGKRENLINMRYQTERNCDGRELIILYAETIKKK